MHKKLSHKKRSNPTNSEKDATRQIAFEAICQVLENDRSLDSALETPLFHNAEARDKAASYRLIVCFLRQKGTLEAIVEPYLRRAPPQRVLWMLCLGVAQIVFLETPVHASIDTTVNLARANGFSGLTGLVNAVLRRVSEKKDECLDGIDQALLNTPQWLWREWDEAGFEPEQLAQCSDMEPPLDLSIKSGVTPPEGGEQLLRDCVRYPAGTKVNTLPGYEEGDFWVQDVAATLPALLLNVQKGEKVADLCAAPGGKTAQLIQAGGQVVAVEKEPKRIKRLQENLKRLRLKAEVIRADAGFLKYKDYFDAVLLDAPCSATGIFRRHPDVLHIKKREDIDALISVQRALIRASLTYLKKGGRLIYSVCSLQQAEAEEQAAYIASLPGVSPMPFAVEEVSFLPEALTPQGWVRTLPFMWGYKGGMDGFFMARFRRD